MINLTKEQRKALARVYRRIVSEARERRIGFDLVTRVPTYRKFRKTVQPGPDCIMVPFAGMWLGIERDGYTHS